MGPHNRANLKPQMSELGQRRKSCAVSGISGIGGRADLIHKKADIASRMSAPRGRADPNQQAALSPLIAKNGHSEIILSCDNS